MSWYLAEQQPISHLPAQSRLSWLHLALCSSIQVLRAACQVPQNSAGISFDPIGRFAENGSLCDAEAFQHTLMALFPPRWRLWLCLGHSALSLHLVNYSFFWSQGPLHPVFLPQSPDHHGPQIIHWVGLVLISRLQPSPRAMMLHAYLDILSLKIRGWQILRSQ